MKESCLKLVLSTSQILKKDSFLIRAKISLEIASLITLINVWIFEQPSIIKCSIKSDIVFVLSLHTKFISSKDIFL